MPVMPSHPGDDHPIRLAIVISHPIQHFCPQYSSWSRIAGIDLRVFFASQHGLTTYFDKDFAASIRWDGLALNFPHEFLPGAAERPITSSLDVPSVGGRLAEFRPHVLCVYGYSQRLQRRAAAWARNAQVPLLMVMDSQLRSKRSWIRRVLKAFPVPALLGRVDRFLTVGDANEAYLRHYGIADERFVRCYLPIDVESFDQVHGTWSNSRNAVRSQHGIPDHHHVVLMVGKLAERKRQQDLVAFSNQIGRLRADVTVLLAGSGQRERELQRLIRIHGPGGVILAGFVQPKVLAGYYAAADIYVHCSEVDAYPLAVSEAVYSGLPVVLSDRCGNFGPSDSVRPGLNGYVYPCGDVDAMTSALSRLLESRDRRVAMGHASRSIGIRTQRLSHGDALLQALDSLGLTVSQRPTTEIPDPSGNSFD